MGPKKASMDVDEVRKNTTIPLLPYLLVFVVQLLFLTFIYHIHSVKIFFTNLRSSMNGTLVTPTFYSRMKISAA